MLSEISVFMLIKIEPLGGKSFHLNSWSVKIGAGHKMVQDKYLLCLTPQNNLNKFGWE